MFFWGHIKLGLPLKLDEEKHATTNDHDDRGILDLPEVVHGKYLAQTRPTAVVQ